MNTPAMLDPAAREKRAWIAAFLLTPAIALLGVMLFLKLFNYDLSVPFEYGHDAFLVSIQTKVMLDHGWWQQSDILGAPMTMDFLDYPSNPSVHIALLKVMSIFERDVFRLLNYYFLFSFPLIAVLSLAAFKSLKMSPIVSSVMSLIFTFAPYHFWRGIAHLWLGVYFTVPLGVILLVWVFNNREGLFFDIQDGKPKLRLWTFPTLAAVAMAAALGFDFPYYPIFACFLLLFAGAYAAIRDQARLPLYRAAVTIVAIAGFFILNVTPNLIYRLKHGKNPSPTLATLRHWNHAEQFGLTLAQMVLPTENHPIRPLQKLRARFNNETIAPSEGSAPALGTVATIGMIVLLGWVFFFQNRSRTEHDQMMNWMTIMALAAFLLGTIGGLGTVCNIWSIGALRGYNRISIFISFFALVPVGLWLARLELAAAQTSLRTAGFAALSLVMVLWSMFEQSRYFRISGEKNVAEMQNDQKFVAHITDAIGAKGKVFQFPVQNFLSQAGPAICIDPYTHFRGYLHSNTLTWSFGAVSGRNPSRIQNWINEQGPAEAIKTLALMGFNGVYFDRKLYPDHGAGLEAEYSRILGQKPVVSDNDRLSFFTLREFTAKLEAETDAEELAAMRDDARRPILADWLQTDVEEVYPDTRFRWVRGREAQLRLENLSNSPKKYVLRFKLATGIDQPSTMTISGLGGEETFPLQGTPRECVRELTVPPGVSTVTLKTDAKAMSVPGRDLTFQIIKPTLIPAREAEQVAEKAESEKTR